MTDRLDDVLQQLAGKPSSKADKEFWLAGLESLRALTEAALREQVERGVVRIEDGAQKLSEPDFGQYQAPSWRVHFGDWAIVDFHPRGGQVVGAIHRGRRLTRLRGRVDVTALDTAQSVALFLTDSDGSASWEHLPDGAGAALEPLTGSALREMLADLLQPRPQG